MERLAIAMGSLGAPQSKSFSLSSSFFMDEVTENALRGL